MRREKKVAALATVSALACAGAVWGVAAMQAGCTPQGTCDPKDGGSVTGVSLQTSTGTLWQTSPIEGTWLQFDGQESYYLYPTFSDGGRMPGPYTFPEIMVSADKNPYTNPNSNFAPSAGNIAEILPLDGGFQVMNNTCSQYYLWMQVAQEYGAAPGGGDSGTD